MCVSLCVRRKAEEDRMRKEEEKARRELIKQEYLRRKQQELMEEQGVAKPRHHRRRPRPKSLHRGQSGTATRMTGLCTVYDTQFTEWKCMGLTVFFPPLSLAMSLCEAPSGSSLSLASAVTEADSITSGGGSQRLVYV